MVASVQVSLKHLQRGRDIPQLPGHFSTLVSKFGKKIFFLSNCFPIPPCSCCLLCYCCAVPRRISPLYPLIREAQAAVRTSCECFLFQAQQAHFSLPLLFHHVLQPPKPSWWPLTELQNGNVCPVLERPVLDVISQRGLTSAKQRE